MAKKKSRWTEDEDKTLKDLRMTQLSKNMVSWNKIRDLMNLTFKTKKTAKQCRERYISFLKFEEQAQTKYDWSKEELVQFTDILIQYGSSWTLISKYLKTKSENCIKNRFHNSLRKAANALNYIDSNVNLNKKKSIDPNMLLAIIDLAFQSRNLIRALGYTPNENSVLLQFRRAILKFSLESEDHPLQHGVVILRQIKALNLKLRCFGIFKVKNRKQWKISMKTLRTIFTFDDIIVEKDVKLLDEKTNPTSQDDGLQEQNWCTLIEQTLRQPNTESIAILQVKQQNAQVKMDNLLLEANQILGIDFNSEQHHDFLCF